MREVEWNGFCLVWNAGLNVVPLASEPSDHEKALIMQAYDYGFEAGRHAGIRKLQNDFRNLMDCQPR
jgi:hypothetical protein